ncbi:hypothetical protein PHYSODRAFT_262413 [Phytophthora sojae]|uniref:Uncharacterized protein n=1 Tax=Phytophthora sojae (strain P6497) TaxID=1094619 RepID=G4ZHG8_PHYSP|nr:hypothetical protein PHYSODRAFT_262413 [Phytophthora sojae]EGZ17638.1 hypothetical protein PHYSODRAFT_262413 [Phytophthora sojae]|eukprot:XP_009526696.1 hypothetical protein PHYSODRAFT_262413 [Phytophthora sojae]
MQRPYMRVTFVDQQSLTMMNPKPFTCAGFGTCSYWHRTSAVSWMNISSDLSCYFFEDENCKTDGYYFISSCKRYAGEYKFKKDKPSIRSLMLSELTPAYRGHSIDYMSACPKMRKEAGGITANDTDTRIVWGMDDESGGLSSNWNDALPDNAQS